MGMKHETNTLLGTRTRRTKDWTRLDRNSIISSDLFEFKYVTSIKASLSRLFATRTNGLDGTESLDKLFVVLWLGL